MELLRNVSKWGNSAGVLLPREWMGNQVKIVLVDRTLEIKKEALSILYPYLEDILGIYLIGSYARGEQEKESDIDIIAVSKKTKKEIVSGRYNLSIITLESARKTANENPILILPRLNEAKVILNSSLLEELKDIKVKKSSFKNFAVECEGIIKINRGLINLDKEQGLDYIDSAEVIYSMLLRLRGVFLAKNLIEKKEYSKKKFFNWISREINGKEMGKTYDVYMSVKNNRKIKIKVKVETAEKLLDFLEKEAKNIKNE
ncbi:MAG: DUF2080 family transposase-associated protein [Nanoarchaeota archaeon]